MGFVASVSGVKISCCNFLVFGGLLWWLRDEGGKVGEYLSDVASVDDKLFG